jgi:hypothetical protein
VESYQQLSEIVLTLGAFDRITDTTGRREQKADQDGNDHNDDDKFDKGESAAP